MKVIPISLIIFARNISVQSVELWMQKRQEAGELDGLFEFPGGKIEAGEGPTLAGIREINEEVGQKVDTNDLKLFKIYTHHYNDRSVCLFSHLVLKEYPLKAEGWMKIYFSEPLKGKVDKIPAANYEIIKDICGYLKELKGNGTLEQLWAI